MVKLTNLLVAEYAIKDADSFNLSIINVLDDLSAESYPIVLQKLSAIAMFRKDEGDGDRVDFKILIKNNDNIVIDQKFKVDFGGKNGSKAILQIGGLPVGAPGKLTFLISNDELGISETYEINLLLRETIKVTQ